MYCKQHSKPAQYIQEKIIAALLELMQHFPFQEITITQICQEAQISRASFYRNFDRKEHVLLLHVDHLTWKQLQNHAEPLIYKKLSQDISCHTDEIASTSRPNLELFFQFFYDNKQFFQLVLKNNLFSLFHQISFTPATDALYFQHLYNTYDNPEFNQILFHCVIAAQYTILEQWLANDCVESIPEMVQLTIQIFSNLNPGWLESKETTH